MSDVDPLIHPPARLRLMAILSAVSEAEFATLRDRLDVSDSVLSKHIATLVDAGYLKSRKGIRLGRRTTWVATTPAGSRALARHVAALRELIGDLDPPRQATPASR